jgi:hypothetical protein
MTMIAANRTEYTNRQPGCAHALTLAILLLLTTSPTIQPAIAAPLHPPARQTRL